MLKEHIGSAFVCLCSFVYTVNGNETSEFPKFHLFLSIRDINCKHTIWNFYMAYVMPYFHFGKLTYYWHLVKAVCGHFSYVAEHWMGLNLKSDPPQREKNETLVNATPWPSYFLEEPIVQEAGWSLGPIWTGVVNLTPPPGIRLVSRRTNWAIIMWSALNYWPTATKCSFWHLYWVSYEKILLLGAKMGAK